jgi:hypothetical protein
MSGGTDKATPLISADKRPPKEMPGTPGGRQFPNGDKTIFERLNPDGSTQIATLTPVEAAPQEAAPPAAGGTSLEERIDEALKKAQTNSPPGASTQAAPPARTGAEQPTVVQPEIYRPDGSRVESGGRRVIQPNIVNVDNGLPYPFGNAPAPQVTSGRIQTPAPAAPAAPPARVAKAAPLAAPAEPAPTPAAPAAGYYVSLKSASDEKAVQKEIPVLADKYKSVLGDVQLSSKIADLGAKGVFYRVVAGPLGSRQEAKDLCDKIKGVGGDKACFVTN